MYNRDKSQNITWTIFQHELDEACYIHSHACRQISHHRHHVALCTSLDQLKHTSRTKCFKVRYISKAPEFLQMLRKSVIAVRVASTAPPLLVGRSSSKRWGRTRFKHHTAPKDRLHSQPVESEFHST